MTPQELDRLTTRFLDAWNDHDVDRVLECYTPDLRYRDPNTRGYVEGRDPMRRYLTKLFAGWRMSWARREAFALEGDDGVAFLWRATFRRPDGEGIVEIDGMDLAVVRDGRLARNDVYFDRALLAPLVR